MQTDKVTSKMPMVLTVSVIVLLLVRLGIWFIEGTGTEQLAGIKWLEVSNRDLAEAGRTYQTKPVLYYFCDENSEACLKVNHGALLNKTVVTLINDRFLAVKATSRPGAEITKELQQKFAIMLCPAFVVTLPNGNQVGYLTNYFGVNAKNLSAFLEHCCLRVHYVDGINHLAHNEYEPAALSLENWLQGKQKVDEEYMNGALLCALSETMLFKSKAAQAVLQRIKGKTYDEKSNWPQPLEQFLLGKIKADDLIRLCDKAGSRLCVAYFFTSMIDIRNGNFESALNQLRRAEKINECEPEIHALILCQLSRVAGKQN